MAISFILHLIASWPSHRNIHTTHPNTFKTIFITITIKMQYSTALVSLLAAASTVMAAPSVAPREEVSAMAAVPEWTIKSFKRTCNSADTSCTVSFSVDTHLAAATPCTYTVTGSPASQASTNGITCGPYTISSGWSGIFGPGNGFTTWSLVDWSKRLITWPSYSDAELAGGKVVTPDKSYAPANL